MLTHRIVRYLRHKLLGFDRDRLLERVALLEERTETFENLLKQLATSPDILWLWENREERMDANDPFFDERRRAFHLARYEFATKFIGQKAVADIACGTGYGTKLLKDLGKSRSVIGIDVAEEAIAYARKAYSGDGITYIATHGNQTGLPDGSIDVVVSFETIEHVPDDYKLLKEFRRILSHEGVLICSTPNNWPVTEHHLRSYTYDSFLSTLSKFFLVTQVYNQNSGTNSPYNHNQPFGITATTRQNHLFAECFIAICSPRPPALSK